MTSKNLKGGTKNLSFEEIKSQKSKGFATESLFKQQDSGKIGQLGKFTADIDYIIKEKYKLSNYCKGGAFGDVFFAKHVVKNYDVAIKFVSLCKNHDLER